MRNLQHHNMFAVIMAGGDGTRFWPLSTAAKPKQFLNLVGSGTMIQRTILRILPLVSCESIYVVSNGTQERELRRQIHQISDIPDHNIILEPAKRSTLPCIGLAASYIQAKNGDASDIMAVFPSDHLIKNEERFLELLCCAREVVQERDCFVTFGINPGYAETGYGYIRLGDKTSSMGDIDIFEVDRFTEKPDQKTAQEFVDSGRYLWNSGIFVWRISTILEMIKKHTPDIYENLMQLKFSDDQRLQDQIFNQVYQKMRAVSIDHGIMEKADNVLVIPSDLDWNDLGCWAAMDRIWQKGTDGNACKGRHIGIDTSGCIIHSDKLVATIGLKEMVIVETKSALLICPKSRAQEVKDIAAKLQQEELDEYL